MTTPQGACERKNKKDRLLLILYEAEKPRERESNKETHFHKKSTKID
jgi:hypothetical protein